MPTLVKTEYAGWPNCYKLSNGRIELVITGDVGPRLIRFGFAGGDNMLYEDPAAAGLVGGDEWRLYGGHRLWHSPEHPVRTYFPDNAPVQVVESGDGIHITQSDETVNGIQKKIHLRMDDSAAQVQLVHTLTNTGPWPIKLSVWALSVMASGGTAIVPMPPRGQHPQDLLPTTQLAIWPYTDMADPRWTWGTRFVLLRQRNAAPQKVGMSVPGGWIAYANSGNLFVKRFGHLAGAEYPDLGSNVEVFTNSDMLEVETLGPLTELAPGSSLNHVEHWYLFDGVAAPENDADVDTNVLPVLAQIHS